MSAERRPGDIGADEAAAGTRRGSLLLRLALFTLLVPGTVAVWVPLWIVARRGFPMRGGLYAVAGALLFAAGAAVYARCARDFLVAGRGTPAPFDPPARLVVRGLYRRVRNPMYLGVLLALSAMALFFGGDNTLSLYAFWTAVVFHLVVVLYEEPTLRRLFGPSYAEYRAGVPRWIPRLRPWTPPPAAQA